MRMNTGTTDLSFNEKLYRFMDQKKQNEPSF